MGYDTPIEVHPDALRYVSSLLDIPRDTVHNAHTVLSGRLNDIGDPFGSDPAGQHFGLIYNSNSEKTLGVIGSVDSGFFEIQDNFEMTAQNYEATEWHNSH